MPACVTARDLGRASHIDRLGVGRAAIIVPVLVVVAYEQVSIIAGSVVPPRIACPATPALEAVIIDGINIAAIFTIQVSGETRAAYAAKNNARECGAALALRYRVPQEPTQNRADNGAADFIVRAAIAIKGIIGIDIVMRVALVPTLLDAVELAIALEIVRVIPVTTIVVPVEFALVEAAAGIVPVRSIIVAVLAAITLAKIVVAVLAIVVAVLAVALLAEIVVAAIALPAAILLAIVLLSVTLLRAAAA